MDSRGANVADTAEGAPTIISSALPADEEAEDEEEAGDE
jgi:hypothetical protein